MLLASVALLAGASGVAHASGYGLRETTADQLGTAFVGGAAKAYDASTVWYNPAGMALLDDNEFEAGVSLISPTIGFSGSNTNPLTGGTVNGGTRSNNIAPAASGANFGVLALNPRWRIGFSVTAPFGQRIAYADDFYGRYQSLVTSVTDINFAIAASYKVNDHFSIGGGPEF
ncbi:MAG TPA: outer membrane protein transport protein, partial [Acidocella sp.]|nr:outer membrane protein transport protein [Acidocella sp.]